MIQLLFILIVTGLSVLISRHLSPEVTWVDYYRGGVGGLFLSAVLLYLWNKKRGVEISNKKEKGNK